MATLRSGRWPLIMIHMLVLQIHAVKGQGADPVSQKLQRLNEQFQQFQAMTQAHLEMLALNHSRNSSEAPGSHVEVLSDRWHHMSTDLEHFKQSTTQEIEGLRERSRKLEKKNKRLEGRLALMERNMRANRRYAQKQRHDPAHNFFNLTLELQSQEERLTALQVQRDELLIGLKGLQESLNNQVLRVTRLDGQLREVLLLNRKKNNRRLLRVETSLKSKIIPQKNYGQQGRGQIQTGDKPGRILYGHAQPRSEGFTYDQSEAAALSRNPPHPHQHQKTPKQSKHSNAQKARFQPDSHPQLQLQHANPEPQAIDFLPPPDPYSPLSQTQARHYPIPQVQSGQTTPYHTQTPPQLQQQTMPQLHRHNRIKLEGSHHQPSDPPPSVPAQSESSEPSVSMRDGVEEEERNTRKESSVIHNLLQLPVRQKIPAQPVQKKDATICNVDSMLVFPSASTNNYVTFSLTLPDLPELSVCLWLRVASSNIGTLLSYATDDHDNQLVLYGHSSESFASSSASSSSSRSSYPPTSFSASSLVSSSSPSLDFVIGDPVYRRLPTPLLLDARWHHLCIVWSSIQGHFWHYNDRRLTSSGSNIRKGWEIPGGGSLVLGQEQDSIGGGFDPAGGFAGQIAGFRMWNRVLSPLEVEGMAEGRGVPRGVVLGMEDIKEVHGEVQQMSCECLEHCVRM